MSFRPSRRDLIGAAITLAGSAAVKLPANGVTLQNSLPLVGVNLASAEFGEVVPGQYGKAYVYPSPKEVDYFAGLGFNCFRLPFLWERLQPDLNGPLNSKEKARLEALVAYITSMGLTAVIDPHNYARRRIRGDEWSKEHLIGSQLVPTDSFVDLWLRLAELFKDDDGVVFGLMNEPYGISAAQWLSVANRTIGAIRSVGAKNLITVPGTQWSGAHSWYRSGNTALENVIDPLERYVIEVHQYFDDDSSGKSPVAVSGSCGSERLREFQNWARQRRVKAFLGEFGGADNPASHNALADICQEMSANPDVWLGWAAWAAGPMWPDDYIFYLGPDSNGRLRPQTRILAEHARPRTPSYWIKPGAVVDIDLARERIYGCPDLATVLEFSHSRTLRSSQPGPLTVRGPLLAVMQAPDFTLIVEVESLPGTDRDVDLITAEGGVMLRRTRGGAVGTGIGVDWHTNPQPLSAWRGRRRCAFGASRSQLRVAIGVTGSETQSREAILPSLGRVTISAGGGGRVVRITAFKEYIDGAALDTLLA